MNGCNGRKPSADLVIRGGTIYTVNPRQPTVEAVVVKEDKIVFAGGATDAEEYIGKNTNVINLEGKTMTPGFIEGHGHFMGLGFNELNIDLMNVTSYDLVVAKVTEAVERAAPGQWIIGRGWHQDKWDPKPKKMVKGFPTHDAISAVSPDNPVYLTHASGHMGLANAKAMELAGVNALSKEKLMIDVEDGGEVIRDELGNPTGIFNERAQDIITKHIPKDSKERREQALQLAIIACHKNGITSFCDAGATREDIELFREYKRQGKLTERLYVMITGFDRDYVYEWLKRGPEIDSANLLTIRSIKLNCDGALGSRGAWLLEPYSDQPGHYGHETLPMDTVLKTARLGLQNGFQVCSHAIGDRTNREVLDRYEIAFKEAGDKAINHRFRIEHAQHLHPDDIPRFGKLNVIPAMQAIHLSSDRPWAIERLGEKRIKEGAYVWQKLLQSGARIVNGTDTPVEPINPIACFFASVTRQTLKGEPEGGYEPDQKMTRDQALRSYTIDAAYGAFEENIKGSIEVGKLADFTIFSQDLMTAADNEILATEVAMTIIGGKIVYQK
ncbi:MAG TPA: amidohydrolase [Cyclobacteriaceae bacterium]|nr:amidohydrolase [Cyclobacteriaceae bacterium]